jgi:hypothetical protein
MEGVLYYGKKELNNEVTAVMEGGNRISVVKPHVDQTWTNLHAFERKQKLQPGIHKRLR